MTLKQEVMLNKRIFKRTVIAVFEKIVSIIVVILFSCLDLFRRNILLHVWNESISVCQQFVTIVLSFYNDF